MDSPSVIKNSTSKESQKRYKAFEKRINEMEIDDLDLTVALGSLRLDKYVCQKCRERINPQKVKLSILNKGDEFFSDHYLDYSFCCITCLREFMHEFSKKNGN